MSDQFTNTHICIAYSSSRKWEERSEKLKGKKMKNLEIVWERYLIEWHGHPFFMLQRNNRANFFFFFFFLNSTIIIIIIMCGKCAHLSFSGLVFENNLWKLNVDDGICTAKSELFCLLRIFNNTCERYYVILISGFINFSARHCIKFTN